MNKENELTKYIDAEEQGLLLFLPCKVGTPIYVESYISCKHCSHSKDKTFSDGCRDMHGELIVDDCEEVCQSAVRSIPFSISMLDDNGELSEGYYLSPEEVILNENT